MDKLDLKKQYRQLYSPSAKAPEIVEVPPLSYIMVDGHGDPNTPLNTVRPSRRFTICLIH